MELYFVLRVNVQVWGVGNRQNNGNLRLWGCEVTKMDTIVILHHHHSYNWYQSVDGKEGIVFSAMRCINRSMQMSGVENNIIRRSWFSNNFYCHMREGLNWWMGDRQHSGIAEMPGVTSDQVWYILYQTKTQLSGKLLSWNMKRNNHGQKEERCLIYFVPHFHATAHPEYIFYCSQAVIDNCDPTDTWPVELLPLWRCTAGRLEGIGSGLINTGRLACNPDVVMDYLVAKMIRPVFTRSEWYVQLLTFLQLHQDIIPQK